VHREQNVQRKTYSVIEWEYGGRNGKAAKPRCFKNLKINNLPVIWRNNKNTCMAAAKMEEWLNMFNTEIKKENRNAILFPDNPTCHPKITRSNVKVASFPANAISVLQPMDMGVIYTFQIALQTISDAMFDFECKRSR
jgi:hypothetical protein